MREPRAFAELETKIGQEDKPAKKPAEPKQANPKQAQSFPDKTFDKAQKKIDADKDTYKVIPDFKFPFEEGYDEDYERSYGPGADADDIDQELAYSKDLYKGKSDDEVIATLSQRLNTHPEKIKKLWKERGDAYKEAQAQFPKLEEAIAKTYPEGTDEYKTFDSQFLMDFMYDSLPKPLGGDQLDNIGKEFAKYLHSKGYKDVSNNPIVDYAEQGKGNQLQDELQGLVADLKATSQAQKEPLEYDERFLEDATGYLTKSLDEQGKAEINKQFKEMLDKAGFKNITPGAEAVESANAKQSALSQYFGGEEYEPTDWDEDVFTNTAGEEYYVATPEEAYERAKEEVRSFIEDQGLQGFSDQFKDWILSDGLNPNFLKNSKDEYIESFREEGNEDAAQWLESMDDEQFLDTLRYELIGDDDSFWNYIDPYGIDRDRIIEEAIDWDGVAHFLAYYDGDEIELPNGLYAYRLN